MNEVTLFVNPCSKANTKYGHILLQDKYGAAVEIHKALLTDNHIQVIDGAVNVSYSFFFNWFGDIYKKVEPDQAIALRIFIKNLAFIRSNIETINADSRLFMAELPFSYYTAKWRPEYYLTIGILLKAWDSGELDHQCPQCNNILKLLNIGVYSEAQGYCFNCRRIVRVLVCSQKEYFNKFENIKKRYRRPANAETNFTIEEAMTILRYLNKYGY